MGESFSKVLSKYCPEPVLNVLNEIGRKRKRSESDEDDELGQEKLLNTPKKIKLTCTTEYIYKALFLEGGNSDITVDILGEEWKLHKIYLQQSPYFASMFSGSWNESDKTYIKIEVADSNITLESLKVVLGSLYFDEPEIKPNCVINILAAATLFQMDGLIEQCINLMLEHISAVTVIEYYTSSCQYGIQTVKQATKEWFCVNLLDYYLSNPLKLRELDIELMEQLVVSPELIVIPAEYSLYSLLKLWMYLKLNPVACENNYDKSEMKKFFKKRAGMKIPFLLTDEGIKYKKVFEGLHIHNLFLHIEDLNNILKDNIIPETWLFPHLLNQYKSVLQVYQSLEHGPTQELPLEEFHKYCVRCGRILKGPDSLPWRWKLFSFGLHLSWSISDNVIRVQRVWKPDNIFVAEDNTSREVLMRVKVASVNNAGKIKQTLNSGMIVASMTNRTEIKVLDLGKDIQFPLLVGVSILNITPEKQSLTE